MQKFTSVAFSFGLERTRFVAHIAAEPLGIRLRYFSAQVLLLLVSKRIRRVVHIVPETHAGVGWSIFIGERYDAVTQLSYLNARYYDAARGQFTSQDSVFWEKQDLSNPQSLNSYSYALNNPINRKDPDGRASIAAGLQALVSLRRGEQIVPGDYLFYLRV